MKILIIEDDAIVAVMQKMWITKACQCDAKIFPNGLEAINFLDQELEETPGEDFLIFLDINMPIMNGWKFLETCEDRWYVKQLSIVIVTSSEFDEDLLRAKRSPLVIDYQNKPIDAKNIPCYLRSLKKDFSFPGFPDVHLN